ncbi:hypothetical protein [Belliella aquatica]|uniref:Uncharacterized protein n=1 Tax=Belliella aquatica TaxID=1323734 RepID=A0ABQ1MJI6_9BACT|nr:hypothetical protein [Belliella aquatica]MCH7404971.1 hypothetical protein [Belliella aquatica]GGC40840.1 hypothetical protein GCM10010993_19490 [Belliella aquatica]
MENLDIIILTSLVVIAFVIFITTSIKEFIKMEEDEYEFEKSTGPTRAALFNVLSSFFDDDDISEDVKERYKSTIKRTISDMHTDGMYFDKKTKKKLRKNRNE